MVTFASGFLTGKYDRGFEVGKESGEGRLHHPMAVGFSAMDERKHNIAETIVDISKILGRTPAQVALNWLRQQPDVVIPIIGARNVSQVKDNLASVDFTIENDHLRRLDEASKIELGFPYDFFKLEMVRQFAYGGMIDEIDNHRC